MILSGASFSLFFSIFRLAFNTLLVIVRIIVNLMTSPQARADIAEGRVHGETLKIQ